MDAFDAAQLKSVRGDLNDSCFAAFLGGQSQCSLHHRHLVCRAVSVNGRLAGIDLYGSKKGCLPQTRLKDRPHKVGCGRLPVGPRNPDLHQALVRFPMERFGKQRSGLAWVRHADDREPRSFREFQPRNISHNGSSASLLR